MLRRWWADKYGRPPDDPRLNRLSYAEILLEFYEDLYRQQASLEAQLAEAEGTEEAVDLRVRLSAINDTLSNDRKRTTIGPLGSGSTGDPLVDRWLLELEEGRVPDLYEGLTEEERKAL